MSELIEGLAQARKVFRFMAAGIMPSQGNAQRAQQVLQEAVREDESPEAQQTDAARIAAAMAMGIAPSQANCRLADKEVESLIQRLTQQAERSAAPRPRGA